MFDAGKAVDLKVVYVRCFPGQLGLAFHQSAYGSAASLDLPSVPREDMEFHVVQTPAVGKWSPGSVTGFGSCRRRRFRL